MGFLAQVSRVLAGDGVAHQDGGVLTGSKRQCRLSYGVAGAGGLSLIYFFR